MVIIIRLCAARCKDRESYKYWIKEKNLNKKIGAGIRYIC
jgi:hypothetical protein